MRTTDTLYNLIKSLDKTEKRNFRALATAFNEKDQEYIRLFEILDAAPENPPEQQLEKQFKALPVLKHYTQEKILRALHYFGNFHAREIMDEANSALIFASKNQTAPAIRAIKTAIRQALDTETTALIPHLVEIAISIIRKGTTFSEYKDQMRDLLALAASASESQNRITQLEHLHLTARELILKHPKPEDINPTISTWLTAHILTQSPLTQKENYLQNLIRLDIAQLQNHPHKTIEIANEILPLLNNPNLPLSLEPELKLEILRLLMKSHSIIGDIEKTYIYWYLYYKEIDSPTLPVTSNFIHHCLTLFAFALDFYDHEKVNSIETVIEERIVVDGLHISNDAKLRLHFYQTLSAFNSNSPKEALKKINTFLQVPKSKDLIPLQGSARILNLLIHISLGNTDMVESQLRATRTWFKKHQAGDDASALIFEMIHHWLKSSPENRTQLLKSYLPQFQQLELTQPDLFFLTSPTISRWLVRVGLAPTL
jgi:hypothetical protein